MSKFANLENGEITINTYRKQAAIATTLDDLLQNYSDNTDETLVADMSDDDEIIVNTARILNHYEWIDPGPDDTSQIVCGACGVGGCDCDSDCINCGSKYPDHHC